MRETGRKRLPAGVLPATLCTMPEGASPSPRPATLPSVFWTFFTISALTIGGGYAMIPVISTRVTRRGWMDEKEFYDLFALAQAVPGPMALNAAVLVGSRLLGFGGAAAAFLGIMLPPVASIVLVTLVYNAVAGNRIVQGFLEGSYGTILGLVAALLIRMVRSRKWRIFEIALSVLCVAGLLVFKAWALPIVLATIVLARLGAAAWKS
jgi:chromate transporter